MEPGSCPTNFNPRNLVHNQKDKQSQPELGQADRKDKEDSQENTGDKRPEVKDYKFAGLYDLSLEKPNKILPVILTGRCPAHANHKL